VAEIYQPVQRLASSHSPPKSQANIYLLSSVLTSKAHRPHAMCAVSGDFSVRKQIHPPGAADKDLVESNRRAKRTDRCQVGVALFEHHNHIDDLGGVALLGQSLEHEIDCLVLVCDHRLAG